MDVVAILAGHAMDGVLAAVDRDDPAVALDRAAVLDDDVDEGLAELDPLGLAVLTLERGDGGLDFGLRLAGFKLGVRGLLDSGPGR